MFSGPQVRAAVEDLRRSFEENPRTSGPSDTPEPWPELQGCLAITFTSRTGSTFLAMELERRFDIGPIREALNPPQITNFAARRGLSSPEAALKGAVRERASASGWFGFKAGARAMALGERLGLIDRYWSRTTFILLLRKDVIAQAVSIARAKLSGQYHSTQAPSRPVGSSDYSYELIDQSLNSIWRGVNLLAEYHRNAGSEFRSLFYEDFAGGDFESVVEAVAARGVPLRPSALPQPRKEMTKLGDGINLEWAQRFRSEASPKVERVLEQYQGRFLLP